MEDDMSADFFEDGASGESLDISGINPEEPVQANPGSDDKVLMLAARYAAGMPLWNEHDKDGYGPIHEEDPEDCLDPTDEDLMSDDGGAIDPQPKRKKGPKKKAGASYKPRRQQGRAPLTSSLQFERERQETARRADSQVSAPHSPTQSTSNHTPEEHAYFQQQTKDMGLV